MTKQPYQLAWEADLEMVIEEEGWSRLCTMVHREILNTTLKEANYKVLSL